MTNINPQLMGLRTPIAALHADPNNRRRHPQRSLDAIKQSLQKFGQQKPVVALEDGTVIAGNGTLAAAQALGWDALAVVRFGNAAAARAYALADNRSAELSEWDPGGLAGELEADGLLDGLDALWTEKELQRCLDLPELQASEANGSLAQRFGVPPFSVLDQRQGYWQERKRSWVERIGDSTEGRGDALIFSGKQQGAVGAKMRASGGGTSTFDPVLAELAVRWFCPPDGVVGDPFAGGHVRGAVTAMLGRGYVGVELRREQVAANVRLWGGLQQPSGPAPRWVEGDAAEVDLPACDMLLACPPYGDLETYSDDPRDLSNMDWPGFCQAYRTIIGRAARALRANRFAVWVVANPRAPDGNYRDLLGETVRAFAAHGLALYNEAVLVSPAGSLFLRAGRAFTASKKLGRTHQNVLVFVKGDARVAADTVGLVDMGEADNNSDSTDVAKKALQPNTETPKAPNPDNGHGAGDGAGGEDFPAPSPYGCLTCMGVDGHFEGCPQYVPPPRRKKAKTKAPPPPPPPPAPAPLGPDMEDMLRAAAGEPPKAPEPAPAVPAPEHPPARTLEGEGAPHVLLAEDPRAAHACAVLVQTLGQPDVQPQEWLRALQDEDVAVVWRNMVGEAAAKMPAGGQADLFFPGGETWDAFAAALDTLRSMRGDPGLGDLEVVLQTLLPETLLDKPLGEG